MKSLSSGKGEICYLEMRMRQYICHTDHNLWDVIVNRDLEEEPAQWRNICSSCLLRLQTMVAKRNQERVLRHLAFSNTDEYLLIGFVAVKVRKFIQKTGKNMDFKEKQPFSLDKSIIECYNYHGKGHFARECRSGRNQGKRSYGDNGRSNAPTNESSSQALVAQDGLGGYDWSNDFEIEPVNYALMAISSSSSSSSSDNEGEKYKFQNYELKCREIQINNLNLELEKAVKERDEFKLKLEKWEESSKNLDELLNSQISARDKSGLGYGIQLNEMSNNSETDSEISLSVFYVRSSDEESIPANDRFSKADGFHDVPPPITGNFLTPRADISFAGLDEYAIRKKTQELTYHCNVSTARPVSTVRPFAPKIAQTSGAIRPIYPRMDNVRPRGSYSPIKRSYYTKPAFRPKDLKQDVKTFGVQNMTTVGTRAVVNTSKGKMDTNLKMSNVSLRPNEINLDHVSKDSGSFMLKKGNPKILLQDHAVVDSGCSSHMTGNKAYLFDYEDYNGGCVAFGSDPKGAPRKDNVYSLDLKNIVPSGAITCLYANATADGSNYRHRRLGNSPSISFMRPFGYPLTILNTLDSLGKFDGKSDEGYLLGYSTTSKAFRVYNKRTKRVEENLHIDFLEDQPNVAGTGPNWMFDLDFLTNSMNYIPVSVENQVNVDAGTQDSYVAGSSGKDKGPTQEYILLPLQPHRTRIPLQPHEKPSESSPKDNDVQDSKDVADKEGQHQMTEDEHKRNIASQKRAAQTTSINKLSTGRSSVSTANTSYVSAASTPTGVNVGESSFVYLGEKIPIDASTLPNANLPIDPNMSDLEDASNTLSNDEIFNEAYDDDEDVGAVADFNNMVNTIAVSPIPTLKIHKDHPKGQILGDPTLAVQTRGKI
ncbi:putative ribonuclease H-like domain-containing protein [Tanacetum coccineum]